MGRGWMVLEASGWQVLAWQWKSGGRLGGMERGLHKYTWGGRRARMARSCVAREDNAQAMTRMTPKEENANGIVRDAEATVKLRWSSGSCGGEAGLCLAIKGQGKAALGI